MGTLFSVLSVHFSTTSVVVRAVCGKGHFEINEQFESQKVIGFLAPIF